jgi:hypothetical protein
MFQVFFSAQNGKMVLAWALLVGMECDIHVLRHLHGASSMEYSRRNERNGANSWVMISQGAKLVLSAGLAQPPPGARKRCALCRTRKFFPPPKAFLLCASFCDLDVVHDA